MELNVSYKLAEEIREWAKKEQEISPKGTLYQGDLTDLLEQIHRKRQKDYYKLRSE